MSARLTDADIHRATPGYVYGVASSHSGPGVPVPDKPGWFTAGPADHYFITKGNTLSDELKKHYKTRDAAERAAEELNLDDVFVARGLDSEQEKRARAFGKLAGRSWWHEDAYWWVRKQGRYAIEAGDESSCWHTVETLAAVEEEIRQDYQTVWRVIDLDTGEDVPFTREVMVSVAAPGAMETKEQR